MPTCYRSRCEQSTTDAHAPFCSHQCRRIAHLTSAAGQYTPRFDPSGQYQPPPLAPWGWLDARADTAT